MLILANVSEVHAQISTTVSPIASTTTAYTILTMPYFSDYEWFFIKYK